MVDLKLASRNFLIVRSDIISYCSVTIIMVCTFNVVISMFYGMEMSPFLCLLYTICQNLAVLILRLTQLTEVYMLSCRYTKPHVRVVMSRALLN